MPLNRSQMMARIRGRDTQPELILRKGLWKAGIRYRLHARTPGGRADLLVSSAHLAVFIDGCFWHGCPEHYVRPRSRSGFWDAKLRENVNRDRRQTLTLEAGGWRVLRVWEHEVREQPDSVRERILAAARSGKVPRRRSSWRVVKVEFLDAEGSLERRLLEDLRDGALQREEQSKRSTRKVGRVRRLRTT
jgi:DNA mismatch endonuclease (patch repair protein)